MSIAMLNSVDQDAVIERLVEIGEGVRAAAKAEVAVVIADHFKTANVFSDEDHARLMGEIDTLLSRYGRLT